MKNIIKFDDGELILNDDDTMMAIGPRAHTHMYSFWSAIRKGWPIEALFEAVNNCSLIV